MLSLSTLPKLPLETTLELTCPQSVLCTDLSFRGNTEKASLTLIQTPFTDIAITTAIPQIRSCINPPNQQR